VNFFAIRWPRRIRPAQILALVAWFAGVASPGLAQPQPGPTVLTNAAQVRGLTEAEAARQLPVRLRAVVTYFRTNLYSRFMQHDTAGIYLGRSEVEFNLQLGQAVEVEGTTSPDEFAPIVVPQAVRIMRYRARVIGATLDVTSQLGQGTTVTCRFSPRRSAAEQKLHHG
jgi:hypothetical protein